MEEQKESKVEQVEIKKIIEKKEYDFNPEQIFQILPNLLNKMIIGMFKGKSSICSSFIRCYFQYVLLFKKLCLISEDDSLKYINHLLNIIFG